MRRGHKGRPKEPRIIDPATHPKEWVGLAVAADYLGVDVRTVRARVRGGSLPADTDGGKCRIGVEVLARYHAQHRLGGVVAQTCRAPVGGVYFVRSGDFIKIGVSSNVFRRVSAACWQWNPHDFTALGWIPERDGEAAQILEHALHRQFAFHRHRGEWFRAAQDLLDFIAAKSRPWPKRKQPKS